MEVNDCFLLMKVDTKEMCFCGVEVSVTSSPESLCSVRSVSDIGWWGECERITLLI